MPGSKRAKSLWLSGFDLILLFLKIIVYEKLIVISEDNKKFEDFVRI